MANINKRTYYEGKILKTSKGDLLITKYIDANNVQIKFLNTGYETTTSISNIKSDGVKNWLLPTVFGVGINDIKEPITSPFYKRWKSMLRRCYDKDYLDKYPTYKGCTVCEEWLTLSNFKSWMEQQDWEGKHLDKDIFGDGKTYNMYSCIFINPKVNTFITEADAIRGQYPLGVTREGKYLRVKCKNTFSGEQVTLAYLGLHQAEEGHKIWKDYKLSLVVKMYETGVIESEKVYLKLKARYEN